MAPPVRVDGCGGTRAFPFVVRAGRSLAYSLPRRAMGRTWPVPAAGCVSSDVPPDASIDGLAGAAFNAAKEIALDRFIAGQLGFMAMAEVVEDTLARLSAETRLGNAASGLEDVLAMDHLARIRAAEAADNRAGG